MTVPPDLPNPDLPPVPVPTPAPAPPTRRNVTCGFCGCELDTHGAVLRRGDKAAAVLDLERTLERRDEEVAALKARIQELTPKPAAKKSLFGFQQE